MEPDRFLTECTTLRQRAEVIPAVQCNIQEQILDVLDFMETWYEEDGFPDWFQEKLLIFLQESVQEAIDGKWNETNRPIR